jgi:hypothetical protein
MDGILDDSCEPVKPELRRNNSSSMSLPLNRLTTDAFDILRGTTTLVSNRRSMLLARRPNRERDV